MIDITDLMTPAYPVEFLDIMTETAIAALVAWANKAPIPEDVTNLIYAIEALRKCRSELVKNNAGVSPATQELMEVAISEVAECSLRVGGKLYGPYGSIEMNTKEGAK